MLGLNQDHQMLQSAVAEIGSRFGHSYFVDCARAGTKTDELWQTVAEAGFVGVSIPEEYGGGGGGIVELTLVIEELSAAGCPLLMLIVSPGICGSVIAAHGSEEQKQEWLPAIANGTKKMAFAITEPDAGSNSHKLSVTATRDGDIWRLNGSKYYISGADEADAILVVTKTGTDPTTGHGQLSLFIVPTDTPGLSMEPIAMEVVAPETQFTLFFDNAAVAANALIGIAGDGLRQVFVGLNPERVTGAAVSNGIARYAAEKASNYARERSVWDKPIGAHQGIAHPLAEAYIHMQLARMVTFQAARMLDAGVDAGEAANIAKFTAAEASLEMLDQAIQTHGGNGLSSEYGLADMWFIARILRTAPVSREMILNFVAQHSLGLPKSY